MTSYQPLRLLRPLGVKTSSVSCQKISLFLSTSFCFLLSLSLFFAIVLLGLFLNPYQYLGLDFQ